MQVVISCQKRHLSSLIDTLEREFGILDVLKDHGQSTKEQQGYIILEWDGEIGPEFESYLKSDERVLDFYTTSCAVAA
jgi:hypothetical protein